MIMVPLNIHSSVSSELDDKDDIYLIAAFNKLPKEITAENIIKRQNRPFLLAVTEELNAKNLRSFDLLDVMIRLGQLRKMGKLRGTLTGKKANVDNESESNGAENFRQRTGNPREVIDPN